MCDECLKSKQDLKIHILNHHMKSYSTQTESEVCVDKKIQVKLSDFNADKNIETLDDVSEEFEHYQCYYCDLNLNCEAHLKSHIVQCTGLHSQVLLTDSTQPAHQLSQLQTKPPRISASPFSLPFQLPQVASYSQTFPYTKPSFILHKCEQCGWTASCGTDMVKHKKIVHNDHRNPFDY